MDLRIREPEAIIDNDLSKYTSCMLVLEALGGIVNPLSLGINGETQQTKRRCDDSSNSESQWAKVAKMSNPDELKLSLSKIDNYQVQKEPLPKLKLFFMRSRSNPHGWKTKITEEFPESGEATVKKPSFHDQFLQFTVCRAETPDIDTDINSLPDSGTFSDPELARATDGCGSPNLTEPEPEPISGIDECGSPNLTEPEPISGIDYTDEEKNNFLRQFQLIPVQQLAKQKRFRKVRNTTVNRYGVDNNQYCEDEEEQKPRKRKRRSPCLKKPLERPVVLVNGKPRGRGRPPTNPKVA